MKEKVIITDIDGSWGLYNENGACLKNELQDKSHAKSFARIQNWEVVENFNKKPTLKKTDRGFDRMDFADAYLEQCSIQKSSVATGDFIWLGLKPSYITVFHDHQHNKSSHIPIPENWQIDGRMHLSREQVAQLLPLLQSFVDTGELQ